MGTPIQPIGAPEEIAGFVTGKVGLFFISSHLLTGSIVYAAKARMYVYIPLPLSEVYLTLLYNRLLSVVVSVILN